MLQIVRYFNKFERYENDTRYPDINSSIKEEGLIYMDYFNNLWNISRDFIQACTKLGMFLSYDFNMNTSTRDINCMCNSLLLSLAILYSNLY